MVKIAGWICIFFLLCLCKKHENFIAVEPRQKNKQSVTDISSPTFNLVHEYQLGSLVIKHYDLYRINDEKELANIGIHEDNPDEITLIEWPEKMKKYKTNNILDLNFEYGDQYKKRFLTISSKEKVSFLDEFKKS